MMRQATDWKVILFTTLCGPVIPAFCVFLLSVEQSSLSEATPEKLLQALSIVYLYGALPAFIAGCLFVVLRRFIRGSIWLAAIAGYLAVLLPLLIFIVTPPDAPAYLELLPLPFILGSVPAMLTYLVARKIITC